MSAEPAGTLPVAEPPVLRIDALSVRLPRNADREYAIEDVSFSLASNEILCLVGESGSGKSIAASAVMRLLPPGVRVDGGHIELLGTNLLELDDEQMRRVRGEQAAMVFQEPMTALNPLHTIGDQIGEMFRIHTDLPRDAINQQVLALLDEVGLPQAQSAARAIHTSCPVASASAQ